MVSIRANLARWWRAVGRACLGAALLLCWHCLGQQGELNPRFEQWLSAQTNLQSWQGGFTQTRMLKVLAQPLVSTGKVWVASDQFRWELGVPAQTIALRQSNQLMIIYPRLKRAERYALDSVPPGPIRDAMGLLDATLPRDRASMEEKFRLLSAQETNGTMQFVLEPKSAGARKFMNQILIGFRTNDFAMAVTQLQFSDGSVLRNDFTNVVLNAVISPSVFDMQLPPGYTVVEPLRK